MSMRADCLPLGKRRKYLGKFRVKSGPYFCPMCGCENETLQHFLAECEELSDLREELFGVRVCGIEWIVQVMKQLSFGTIKSIGRFLRLGMRHRENCLSL